MLFSLQHIASHIISDHRTGRHLDYQYKSGFQYRFMVGFENGLISAGLFFLNLIELYRRVVAWPGIITKLQASIHASSLFAFGLSSAQQSCYSRPPFPGGAPTLEKSFRDYSEMLTNTHFICASSVERKYPSSDSFFPS